MRLSERRNPTHNIRLGPQPKKWGLKMNLSERLAMLPVRKARLKELSALVDEVTQLEDEIEGLRKLAHDYIQAYEKLAFGDAPLTTPEDTPISDIPASP